MKRLIPLLIAIIMLSGCDYGFQNMGATEFGLRFRKLPPSIGGGLSKGILSPGQMTFVWPWDAIYRFDTSVRDISWGKGVYLHTRALDGNEVALAVTVRYRVTRDVDKLHRLLQEVGTTDQSVAELVTSIARSDVRTYMNELRTAEFLEMKGLAEQEAKNEGVGKRYQAVRKVEESMRNRLAKYGIDVERVLLDDFRFERLTRDGKVDASYQEKLKEIQRKREETEQEVARIEVVKAEKSRAYNEEDARVKRVVEDAIGYKAQAQFRGDAYFEAKSNAAKAILAKGQGYVKGLEEKINALTGPGGDAIVRMELAKELLKNSPRFIVMGEGEQGSGLEVRRLDANQLIDQAGLFEALSEKKRAPATGATQQRRIGNEKAK